MFVFSFFFLLFFKLQESFFLIYFFWDVSSGFLFLPDKMSALGCFFTAGTPEGLRTSVCLHN